MERNIILITILFNRFIFNLCDLSTDQELLQVECFNQPNNNHNSNNCKRKESNFGRHLVENIFEHFFMCVSKGDVVRKFLTLIVKFL
jgi:hypothetical protein